MLNAMLAALGEFAHPATFLFLMLGVACGLVVGLLPGLGGTAAVALLLPYVYVLNLPLEQGLPLLVGAVASVHHSDVIAAILLGVPGSAAASATILDGHAMAMEGKGTHALSLAFLCSGAGGLLGAIGLTFTIPIARPLILSFGSPEVFMLSVLGVSLAAIISNGNVLKGLVSAVLGLLLGFVGAAPALPVYRYTFHSLFLYSGLQLATVALGIFGVAEIAYLIAKRTPIASSLGLHGSQMDGVRDFFKYWQLVLRGALVGIWAGILPGVGATAGAFMAYGQTVATAKDKSKFGKGDPRGIVGPESAANSCESGDLIPTLLFGIPGGAPAALLLGALLYYGYQPGPQLMIDHLDAVYVIIWSFALASIFASILCFPLASVLARITTVPLVRLAPALLIIIFLGSFQTSFQFGELLTVLGIGVLGYIMKETDFPRAPLLIGFVLSIPLERYYFLTSSLYTTGEWIRRPFVVGMFLVLAIPLILALYRWISRRVRSRGQSVDVLPSAVDDGAMSHPIWHVGFTAVCSGLIAAALVMALGFPIAAGRAPRLVGVIGLICVVPLLVREAVSYQRRREPDGVTVWNSELTRIVIAFLWMALLVLLTYFVGFLVAVAISVPIFLRWIAHVKVLPLLLYTVLTVVILYGVTYADIALPTGMFLR